MLPRPYRRPCSSDNGPGTNFVSSAAIWPHHSLSDCCLVCGLLCRLSYSKIVSFPSYQSLKAETQSPKGGPIFMPGFWAHFLAIEFRYQEFMFVLEVYLHVSVCLSVCLSARNLLKASDL